MSDTPEPLAAILAEMKRRADEANNGLNGVADVDQIDYMEVEDWVSRIEAAAERERAELRRQLRNEIEINNALATVRPQFHYVDDVIAEAAKERAHETELAKLRAPGNAAAMRAALENLVHRKCLVSGSCSKPIAEQCEHPSCVWYECRAALAEPARNCDKFATADDARDAAKKEFANTMHLDDRQLRAVCDWLFDTAEGGKE